MKKACSAKFRLFIALIATLAIVATTTRADEPQPKALKSAAQLVETLKGKIGAEYKIPESVPYDVLACEQRDHKIVLYKTGEDWNDPNATRWEWVPNDALGPERGKLFGHVDECKPALDRSVVLVASSGGGVAVVRVEDKKVLFFATPRGNTHSIAMLPDGNIVTASSTGAFVALFVAPDPETVGDDPETSPIVQKIELNGGHGVVWDAKRQILWALGYEYILGLEYNGNKTEPELKEVYRIPVTDTMAAGGHDFYPAPGYDAIMATGRGVAVFDPETRTVTDVCKMKSVKSISLTPEETLMIQRAAEEWWNESLLYGDANDTKVGTNSGARFYKARWFVDNEFSEPKE
ncbi:MAG: hypothetical protein IJU03_10980 [Thermoguttaceae bacterium]|nr:hypothetical protein [Thermoguttaceae bacterium]